MRIAKDITIHESSTLITDIGGDYSDLSLCIFWQSDDELMMKALFKNEVVDAKGFYKGSLNDGRRFSPATQFSLGDDSSPTILMRDGQVSLTFWSRDGQLYAAPTTLCQNIISAQCTKKADLEAGFSVEFDNPGGIFSNTASEMKAFFEREKSASLYQGYDGDVIQVATAQADSAKAHFDPDTGTFSLDFKNKYTELVKLKMSKRYGRIFPEVGRIRMVEGFAPSKPIDPGNTIEVKIEAPAPARWYPGTVEVESISGGGLLSVVGPYGQSETMCFVRISNTSDMAVNFSINLTAIPCTDLAEAVYTGSLTVKNGTPEIEQFFMFADGVNCDPLSYQIRITGVSGGGVSSIAEYLSTYHPQNIIFDPVANGIGIQIKCYDNDGNPKNVSSALIVHFEIWARRLSTKFVRYHTAREVLIDLAKLATRKELLLGSSDDQLNDDNKRLLAGQFSKHVFVQIEEGFDPETVRVVNTTDATVNMDILDKGYITNDDGYLGWGVRVAITRAQTSLSEKDFSFQIWGQYTDRTDFIMPFTIDIPDTMNSEFSGELSIIDSTIEDAINKVLQICFDEEDAKHKLIFGSDGQGVLRPYKLTAPVMDITVRNMQEITKTEASPQIIDRIEVKGKISESYAVSEGMELIHDQTKNEVTVERFVNNNDITIEFDRPYLKDSLVLRDVWTDGDCTVYILERHMNYCIVRIHNKSWEDIHRGRAKFQLWGQPLNAVNYQEDFTYKTSPGSSGKYTHVEAEINNELINSMELADRVANTMVLESANGQQDYEPTGIPAHPGLEPLDTVRLYFEEVGAYQRAVVEEISPVMDGNGDATEYVMGLKLKPFDRFATDSASGEIGNDGETGFDGETELKGLAGLKVLFNLFFG